MKLILMAFLAFAANHALAVGTCKDANFDFGSSYFDYDELEGAGFKLLFESRSVAPAGFPDYFGRDGHCHAVTARYLEHVSSKKKYVMYTTHDDYCDGGNTVGVVVDLEIYENDMEAANSQVAQVGDSGVYCTKE